jgi:hypothetical protein
LGPLVFARNTSVEDRWALCRPKAFDVALERSDHDDDRARRRAPKPRLALGAIGLKPRK